MIVLMTLFTLIPLALSLWFFYSYHDFKQVFAGIVCLMISMGAAFMLRQDYIALRNPISERTRIIDLKDSDESN